MVSRHSPGPLPLTVLWMSGVVAAAVPNAPPQLCVNNICSAAPTLTPPVSATQTQVKWHPGHYMLSNEADRSADGQTASKRYEQGLVVAAGPNVVGWAGVYTWDILEPTKGNYDFSHIDADIAALSGKRIIIGIVTGYSPSNHLPPYILNDASYGPSPNAGQYGFWTIYSGAGVIGAKWRSSVNSRWIALIKALGARYDSNPLVEAIVDHDETAWNLDGGSDYSIAGFRAQWDALGTAAAAALPTTNFVQQHNWVQGGSIQDSADFTQDAYTRRVAFGGPDIFGYSTAHSNPAYVWSQGAFMGGAGTTPGTDYRGKMAAIHDVQSPELTGGLGTYTPQDIFNFADGDLHVDHILWNYVGGTGPGNWNGGANSVLALINAHPVTHKGCPAAYTSGCRTN